MDEVRRLRLDKGWSQNELAYHAKLAPSVISLIETGKRDPNATTLRKLAEALEVRIPDLFEESGSGKGQRRSSPEPSLFNGVEDERRSSIAADAVSAAAQKWDEAASNPNATPYEVSAAADAALGLAGALMEQVGQRPATGYSPEQEEVIHLASRLLAISEASNERILESGRDEQVIQRREQMRELTQRISA